MSKLLLISDLHIRENAPIGRIDNFQESMWWKLEYLFKIASENGVDAILQAGDLFDKPNPSYSLVIKFVNYRKIFGSNIPFYTIPGQHDLYMRNQTIDKVVFGLLQSLGGILVVLNEGEYIGDHVMLFGVGFGQKILPLKNILYEINILMIHAMIGNASLYPGHEYSDAGRFLAEHSEYSIILCGDYHYPFHIRRGNRHIVNTGCMLRLTRDERDMNRVPHFYIVDTEKNEWRKYELPCEFANRVFASKMEIPEKLITNEGDLLRFIEQLRKKGKSGINYLSVLNEYCKEHEISDDVVKLIEGVLI